MGLLNFAYQAIQDMWDNWPDEEVLKHGSTNSVNVVVSRWGWWDYFDTTIIIKQLTLGMLES